jgi:uncharacterized repeat protein (TIGR03803 family)
LYSFGTNGSTDASNPEGSLEKVGGTFYGTANQGGTKNDGAVYSVTPSGTETVLDSFTGGAHGSYPLGNLVYLGGTLYGTTFSGGGSNNGTIFSIVPGGAAKILHNFSGAVGGANPYSGLYVDAGTMYGTTGAGGAGDVGTVYKITTAGASKVLHTFEGNDGERAEGSLVAIGPVLYGTTNLGGLPPGTCGAVYGIDPSGKGQIVIHTFTGAADGCQPRDALLDVGGTLYGATSSGGTYNAGVAFSVTPAGKETVLHTFGAAGDGAFPAGGLINVGGTLYGVTSSGGTNGASDGGDGTVFAMTLAGSEHVVHNFAGTDGSVPKAALTAVGTTLYGTTDSGGAHYKGTVFRLQL